MNFSFQFVCSTQIKMYQESGFSGAFFDTLYCRIAGASWSFALGRPRGLCPRPTGGLQHPPDPLLFQAITYGHCISCLRQDTTFIHALMINLGHHTKFLKKGLLFPLYTISHCGCKIMIIYELSNRLPPTLRWI